MMINHVVFDLDGTLTDRNTGNIPKSTLEAIDQLKKRGITIILATGRPYYEIDPILVQQINADYVVSLNGRVIYNDKKEMLWNKAIEGDVVQQVIDYANKMGLEHGVHTLEETIILSGDSIQKQIENVIKRPRDLKHSNHIDHATPIYNIMIKMESPEQIKGFRTEFPELIVETFGSIFFDVYSKDVDKSVGIDHVFKMIHGQWSKTLVFGDGANDICMAKKAEIAFAMGDAHPDLMKVKSIRVTSKSDEAGIPNALRKLGMIEHQDHRHGWQRFKHRFITTKMGTTLPIAFFLLLAFAYDKFIADLPGDSLSFLGLGLISFVYSVYLYLDTK